MPKIGLGAAALGNLYRAIEDEEARKTLDQAMSEGLHYIDTAPHYGAGESERRIGEFLASSDYNPLLSTKVGRRLVDAPDGQAMFHGFVDTPSVNPVFDYTERGVREAFASSLSRLGVESVDVLLLHDVGEMTHGDAHERIFRQAIAQALPEMERFKEWGRTKAIGIGVNEVSVCEAILKERDLDVILLAGRYTLFEHENALALLNECQKRGVAVIIGGAFNSGLLVQTNPSLMRYNYEPAPQWALQRRKNLEAVCRSMEVPLPAAALAFCLAHPAVISVIPGAQTSEEVRQIATWRDTQIPVELWNSLRQADLISNAAPTPS